MPALAAAALLFSMSSSLRLDVFSSVCLVFDQTSALIPKSPKILVQQFTKG